MQSIGHVVAVLARIDIVALFPPEGRGGSRAVVVARPDDGILRQFHQTANGGSQGGAVTSGQIGAPAVAHEKGVAREEVALSMEAAV